MKLGRPIGLGLALAAIVGIAVLAVVRWRSEPRWNGRSVTEWLVRLDRYESELRQTGGKWSIGSRVSMGPTAMESPEAQRRRAEEMRREIEFSQEAIRQIGTNGFAVMGRMLEATDSKVRREVVVWMRGQSWIRWQPRLDHEWHRIGQQGFRRLHDEGVPDLLRRLEAGNAAGRRNAAVLLGEIRTRGPTVIPRLAAAMRDPDHAVRVMAAQALSQRGRGPVGTWIGALSDAEAGVRLIAAQALSRMGQRAVEARPNLLRLLDDPDSQVRDAAVGALGSMGEGSPAFIEHLLKHLGGERPEAYVRALGEAGPAATNAIPRLWEIVEAEAGEQEAKGKALGALGKIAGRGPVDAGFVERLAGFVEVEGLGTTAVEALGRLGSAGVPALIRVLESTSGSDRPDVIEKALEVLLDSRSDVVEALPVLVRWAGDANDEIARAAVRVLERMPRGSLPHLARALDRASPTSWCVLARILGSFELRDDRFVGTLIEALGNPALAPVAAEVLGRLKADPGRAIPALMRCAEGVGELKARVAAIDAIGRYARGAGAALGFLKGLLGLGAWADAEPSDEGVPPGGTPGSTAGGTPAATMEEARMLALHAAGALARIEPGAETIRPVLDHALRHGTAEQRSFAVDVVKDTEIDGRFAVGGLLEVLKGKDLWARVKACAALGKIGPGAEEAVPALLDGIGDPSWMGYSGSVGAALSRIGKPAVPGLMGLLAIPEKRRVALGALHEMGLAAERACPLLVHLLNDPETEVREMACRCLLGLGTNAVSVLPGLVQRAESSAGEPAILAALALSVVDASHSRAFARTVEALRDERDGIRGLAALALRSRRPAAVDAVPALMAALGDPFEAGDVRRAMVETLGVMVPGSPEALRALIGATRDEDEWLARAAVRALGEAGPAAREAVPALRKLLEPSSGWYQGRDDVREALAKIDPAGASTGER